MANHKWVYFNNILQNLIYKTCRECCHPVEAQRNVHQLEAEEFSIPQVINKSKWQTYKTDSTKSIPKSCILVSRVGGGLGHGEGEWRSGDTQIELIETSCLSEEMKPLNSMGKKNGHHSGGSDSFKKSLFGKAHGIISLSFNLEVQAPSELPHCEETDLSLSQYPDQWQDMSSMVVWRWKQNRF